MINLVLALMLFPLLLIKHNGSSLGLLLLLLLLSFYLIPLMLSEPMIPVVSLEAPVIAVNVSAVLPDSIVVPSDCQS